MDSFWGHWFKPRSEAENLRGFLGRVSIFSGLKPRDLKALERIVHCRHYQAGEVVFRKDDPGVGLYIIRSGMVEIILGSEESPLVLARLQPGDFFGDASLSDGAPRSATALVRSPGELIGLFRPDLLDLCERNPRTGSKVLWNVGEVLAERLRRTNEELKAFQSAAGSNRDKNKPTPSQDWIS